MTIQQAHQHVFAEVLKISKYRILQRLVPPWVAAPAHWTAQQKKKRTSLFHRIRHSLLPELQAEAWAPVVSKLNLLLDVLGCLETEQADLRTHQLVRDAVNGCASASTGEQAKSLESQLEPLMSNLSETVRKVIAQIDKIARYSSLCNDIVKMMTRPRLRKLFQHLHLEPLYSPKASRPPGSPERCYIHAEVQLIFYYEENPKLLPPRVLGCSKSACFLCDLLIQQQAKF